VWFLSTRGDAMSDRGPISRSKTNAMMGGVCAGIARHFGWSATGTRVAYVLLSIISAAFPGILVYLILWLALPQDD